MSHRVTFKFSPICRILAAIACLSFLTLPAAANHSDRVVVALGDFVTTDLGQDRGFEISGRAMLVRKSSGTTEAYTQVLGLDPNTDYASHVHDLPCALGGGGHYKIDPTVGGTVEANEIWPLLSSDGDGTAHGFDSADHLARPEAQSIVIHDPSDGGRIACADVVSRGRGATLHRGDFSTFAAGSGDITGVAQMVRSNQTTYVTVFVEGLAPSTAHGVHVHGLPCGVNEADGHYKIDPTEPLTLEENEIWPAFTTDANGVGIGAVGVLHAARPEAQSVVVHAPGGAKIACADLERKAVSDRVTEGQFLTTAVGIERGFLVTGEAVLTRKSSGSTSALIAVAGLDRRTTYPAHVHDRPCRLGGGGHYKIDPSEPGTVEENEIWPTLMTGFHGSGIGFDAVSHLARPEAQAIVIHDPTDGARLACADLD